MPFDPAPPRPLEGAKPPRSFASAAPQPHPLSSSRNSFAPSTGTSRSRPASFNTPEPESQKPRRRPTVARRLDSAPAATPALPTPPHALPRRPPALPSAAPAHRHLWERTPVADGAVATSGGVESAAEARDVGPRVGASGEDEDARMQLDLDDWGGDDLQERLRQLGMGYNSDEEVDPSVPDWIVYVRAIEAQTAFIVQVNPTTWAVPSWNKKKRICSVDSWCHLEIQRENLSCSCLDFIPSTPCVHLQLHAQEPTIFSRSAPRSDSQTPEPVILFLHHGKFLVVFSISTDSVTHQTGKRHIVALGEDAVWTCTCRGTACGHKKAAKSAAVVAGLLTDEHRFVRGGLDIMHSDDCREREGFAAAVDAPSSVSHVRRGPPRWCRLDTPEDAAIPIYTPPSLPPSPFLLGPQEGSTAACRCGRLYSSLSPEEISWAGAPEPRRFVVYGELMAYQTTIQTIPCPDCKHPQRHIGPDLLDSGMLNWSNDFGFVETVFHRFLSQYTNSPTSFIAFHTTTLDSYLSHHFPIPFPSEATFRRAYFAYLHISGLDSGMKCPVCGPRPTRLVGDGTDIGYGIQGLTEQLTPPTFTSAQSPSHPSVKHFPWKCFNEESMGIGETAMNAHRGFLLGWFKREGTGRSAAPIDAGSTLALAALGAAPPTKLGAKPLLDMLLLFQQSPVGDLRNGYRFFLQQICSNDMILQIISVAVFADLNIYITTGVASEQLYRRFPALALIITASPALLPPPPPLKHLLMLLLTRAQAVFQKLLTNHAPVVEGTPLPEPDFPDVVGSDLESWKRTGCCMGAGPKLRERGVYPAIEKPKARGDGGEQSAHEKEKSCRKDFEGSHKHGKIGGLCGLWCPHGICVGFHFMPRSEGRNDMFAAVYCYWDEAPLAILYDYACQLATYSLVREPKYYAHTGFYIDELHFYGHSGCSSACSVAPYMAQDPDLRAVNSSVAEGAHSVLTRIKKSISYMSESHGILFMWSAVQIWNRRKLAGMGYGMK